MMLVEFRIRLLFVLLCTGLGSFVAQSQTFQRIETLAGLQVLAKNHGVAAADIDGDYDIDLFVVARLKDSDSDQDTHSRLFLNNNNGTFTDVTEAAGLGNLHPFEDNHINDPGYRSNFSYDGYKFGASWGDYDNDGDPDLFLTNAYRVQLFRNNGNATFTEVTEQAGFVNLNRCLNTSSVWFDYDNDGYLDIYISDYGSSCGGNTLFKNNQDGTFTNVTAQVLPAVTNRYTYMMFPVDINKDGLLDMYTSNDYLADNNLFESNLNGTTYTESGATYNLHRVDNSMGVDIGDYNNFGDYEIFATNIGNNSFFKRQGGSFVNAATSLGIDNSEWSWDTKFWDYDNDGFLDVFVANGFTYRKQRNKMYVNQLGTTADAFTEQAEALGLDDAEYSCSSAAFDYDNDGDLDLLVTNVYQEPWFYENKTINFVQGADKNWVKVFLKGTTSNTDGIGAQVTVNTASKVMKRMHVGASFYAQNLLPEHFGLGDADAILSIDVEWPSGQSQRFQNIVPNKHYEITEGQGIRDLMISPSIKTSGCTNPNACNYSSGATLDDGSCIFLSPGELTGPTNSSYLATDTYTYNTQRNSSFLWSVQGGHIVSGQGTNTLTVQWGVNAQGEVSVVESTSCSTEAITRTVTLGYSAGNQDFSVARIWNEILLDAIRNDFARPTVHARNLFHASIALYDIWAIHNSSANTYLIGNNVHEFISGFQGFQPEEPAEASLHKAMSFAMYRLITHRFQNSPGVAAINQKLNLFMQELGYNPSITSQDYSNGDAAALGNFVAQTLIDFGLLDGSNEIRDYGNLYYEPVNEPLITELAGIDLSIDPNRWQPLSFDSFIDQSGNLLGATTPDFLSPEWGNVWPFALTDADKTVYSREGNTYNVYRDPGSPPLLDGNNPSSAGSDHYKWGFSLVSLWSAHLDPTDGVVWDISPKSIGNIALSELPTSYADYNAFYQEFDGGDIGQGRAINPKTNQPYQAQMVPRGDYTRVLAEFWADGPDSETPPGHWFTILNYVNDHPDLVKKIGGEGPIVSNLEWDVKSYFALGGAMHDAAVAAWSIKGWYDYIRPISSIRYLASLGQSTDANLPSYHESGIPLVPGYVELIDIGDPLAGPNNMHVGKIKLKAWKGHTLIEDPDEDVAGVDWILGESWVPYQRPSFVTPPFAGFVSGHSTYSRAAAELLTRITGDEYFPGGMAEFTAKKDEFLVFEKGPSVDVVLQWATYRDASDQCSLSRIWGGIHPPADDIPGRFIGEHLGNKAYDKAVQYFDGNALQTNNPNKIEVSLYPNPIAKGAELQIITQQIIEQISILDMHGKVVFSQKTMENTNMAPRKIRLPDSLAPGVYLLKVNHVTKKIVVH